MNHLYEDKHGTKHTCHKGRMHDRDPGTELVWTTCGKDVPAGKSFMSRAETANCDVCDKARKANEYNPDYDARDKTIVFYMEELKKANERNEKLKAYSVELEAKLFDMKRLFKKVMHWQNSTSLPASLKRQAEETLSA